jgi:hypothetical protein
MPAVASPDRRPGQIVRAAALFCNAALRDSIRYSGWDFHANALISRGADLLAASHLARLPKRLCDPPETIEE